ncbi:phage integrase family protein [Rickettsia amblyommatis str. Darkwater]|nr:phage integrase family protein [Rickettsia amblyommatis str. Darkwater]
MNPVTGIKKHQEQSRDRYLTREEIPQFFTAIAEEKNQVMKDFFLIALYTSVRKDNLLTMRWEQVNFTDKQLYLPETKNGDPHRLPLLDQAIEILQARKIKLLVSGYFQVRQVVLVTCKNPRMHEVEFVKKHA